MSKVKIDTGAVGSATSAFATKVGAVEVLGAALSVARGAANPVFAISTALSGEFHRANQSIAAVEKDVNGLITAVCDIASYYESVEQQVLTGLGGSEKAGQGSHSGGPTLVSGVVTGTAGGVVVAGSYSEIGRAHV